MTRRWPYILVFVFAAALYLAGGLEFIEYRLTDFRFSLLKRPASDRLVLVEIDQPSLRQLDVWPWPRRYHARLIENLARSGARAIALDIDLSSRSSPDDDSALADALANHADRVILPLFKQVQADGEGGAVVLHTAPLAAFQEHARVAFVNVRPERDGLVRRMLTWDTWTDTRQPTLPALLAPRRADHLDEFYIDFGIQPQTIPRLSYADVLANRFDPAVVAGRFVIVGSSALSLGDILATPLYSALPGPTVQALAAESLMQGRALQRLGAVPVLAIAFLIAWSLGGRLPLYSWRGGLVLSAGACVLVSAVPFAVQAARPILLDSAPWLVTIVLSYLAALVSHVRGQAVELVRQGLSLRRKDAFMRQVLEHTFDGIMTIDERGAIRSFNTAAEHIFGHPASDVLGADWASLLYEVDGAPPVPGDAGLRSLTVGIHSGLGRHKFGADPHLELAVSAMEHDNGPLTIVLVRDVTARREAEETAAKATERLQDAIESLDQGFALFDSGDRLVLANAQFKALHAQFSDLLTAGCRFDELARAAALSGLYPDALEDADRWAADRVRRHQEAAGSFEQATSNGRWYLVSEHRTTDGDTVLLQTDITAIKRREEEMATLAEKYAQVAAGVEATTTGLAITDPHEPGHPVIFVNPAFTRITGRRGADVVGCESRFLLGDGQESEAAEEVAAAIADERSVEVDLVSSRAGGAEAWTRINLSPVRDDHGRLRFFVWVLNDVTERKHAEQLLVDAKDEAERANRVKSEFLATMSHELRTPLNAIIGFSEMMKEAVLGPVGNPQYQEYVEDIHRSGTHLLEIIMDILNMAKIEAGTFELVETAVPIEPAVESCVRMISERAKQAGHRLAVTLPERLPDLRCDERVLRQVILNLLSNAVKFTKDGGTISISVRVNAAGSLDLTIADTGIGMTQADVATALEPFRQVDSSLSRKYEGSGLGLPLVKSFVEMHDASLEIESEPGVGTKVVARFPPDRLVWTDTPRRSMERQRAQ